MSSTPIKEDSLVEHNSTMGSTEGNSLPSNVPAYDSHTEKKLLRKVDYRLVPILAALYSISVIDRVNVSSFTPLTCFRKDAAEMKRLPTHVLRVWMWISS